MSDLSQDGSIPAVCYATCNDAYLIAQKVGKTPALCAPDGEYIETSDACTQCVQEHQSSLYTKADDGLSQFLNQYRDYCNVDFVLVTATVSATISNREYPVATVTTRIYFANLTASEMTKTPEGGNVPSTSISPGSSTMTSMPPTITPDVESGHRSQAWIAGPVLGSLAGAALILTTAIFLLRRRKKSQTQGGEEYGDKPQLHSDCVPKPELENSEKKAPIELPGTDTVEAATQPHELPDYQNPSELEAPTTTAREQSGQLDTANDRQDS